MMNPSHLQQQTISEGSAVGDETELIGEHDISSISTISKASSAFTDIDGKSQTIYSSVKFGKTTLSVGIGEFGYVNACACIKFKLGSFNNFIQSKNFAEDSRHVILAPM